MTSGMDGLANQLKAAAGKLLPARPRGSFVGVEALVKRHAEQVAQFEAWAAAGSWAQFHRHHYDWWAFPVDETSSRPQYSLPAAAVGELRSRPDFLTRHARGVYLLLLAWGWDLDACSAVCSPAADQAWASWPVRLYKCGRSLQVLGQWDLFMRVQAYAEHAQRRGWPLQFHSSATRRTEDVLVKWREIPVPAGTVRGHGGRKDDSYAGTSSSVVGGAAQCVDTVAGAGADAGAGAGPRGAGSCTCTRSGTTQPEKDTT